MSLRKTVASMTLVVTVIAVVIAGALVVLTTVLHHTTVGAAGSVESIRSVQAAQIDLLEHARARDPLVAHGIEGELRRRLAAAEGFVSTGEETRIFSAAEQRIDQYIATTRDPSRSADEILQAQAAAYGALERLVLLNVEQAKAAQRTAARWNGISNLIAAIATALLVLVATALLVWLRQRAFEPILELAATMERFGRGDHDARAAERGPLELREMCRHFNEMASSIAAQRHARTAFLGGVAHDLRTPLSVLQMSVVLLLDDAALSSSPGLRRGLERINRQIKRMDRMLGDFLDGAKIEAGLLELQIEVHDVRTIVEQVVDLFDGSSAGHPIEVRLPDEPQLLCCDQLRLEQVITNLISNAIKYSPSGGLVEVALRRLPSQLELAVSDHGLGIPPDRLGCLFEPFRRAGLSSEAVPGVGLGLFVVRRIVEAHGGCIEVDSVAGRGSTFRVLLPAQGQPMT